MSKSRDVRALLLAAGLGTRLKPLTDAWPKCLMPIGNRPLLEYWLQSLQLAGIQEVCVNLHHHADIVSSFLDRPAFQSWVTAVQEPTLLGTAATLRANAEFLQDATVLLVHADNWSNCDLKAFIAFHQHHRKTHCPISMMTFNTDTPQSCGIVVTDSDDVVVEFHEKVENPPGNRANGAVYLLEPEVLHWLQQNPSITDFSTEVLPRYIGRIACWHNPGFHRDIGTLRALQQAQLDLKPALLWPKSDAWQQAFFSHPIQNAVLPEPIRKIAGAAS